MKKVVSWQQLAISACMLSMTVVAEPVKVGNPGFMYSVPGSFLTVGRNVSGQYMFNTHSGLWIRNVSTAWRDNFCRLVPSVDGQDVEVTECVMRDGWLEARTAKGPIEFAYLRPDVILVRSKSPEMHIRFEYQFPRQKYDFPSTFGRSIDYMHFNADRIMMDTRVGVRDPDRGNTVRVHPAKDGIEVALLDVHTSDWDGQEVKGSFEDAVKTQKASFDRMYASLPSVPPEFEWARHEAAVLFWTCLSGPRGMFKRPMMLMSNNWMNKTWSWDHAINSLSLGYHDQDAAWEQFRCMFDFMSADGMMPDMVSDEEIYWLAVKPPVHGWIFSKLRAMKEFPKDRLEIAYDLIGRWTNWWLTRRDFDHNGLCEYLDGCDSGWDNSTAICMNRPPLETPDLQAFLILQMESLADIAKTLGKAKESAEWTARSKKMLDALVKILFDEDGTPRVRRLRDNGFDRDSLSLVTRLPLILGKRLPEKCRAKMIDDLKTKGFLTDWGLASESTNSKHYHPNGYWKGPIWGPSTLIAVEGLRACGEDALADEIALKFCKLIMKSGFSENFDAKTGEARRDPAYTWTASAFLVLAHELQRRQCAAAPSADNSRIARIGLMTDTHVHETMESCSRMKLALELFKAKGAELVLNCGDVADQHLLEGYHCYRRTFNSVYPDAASRPKEVYAYAWHDTFNCKAGAVVAYEEMRQHLEAPNGHTCEFTWKGLPFAVMPQDTGKPGFLSWDDYENMVARLCAANPGKPVFVINHVPPQGTTFHSWQWGEREARRILNKYPQVVHLSGHVHGSQYSERQIWQGEFTAINIGCLQTWGGFAAGSTPPHQAKEVCTALMMDVYRDRLVVSRWDVRDRSSCGPDWVVLLPFFAPSAPYAPASAAARVKELPQFAPGAELKASFEKGRYQFRFPEVAAGPRAFKYVLACERRNAAGKWERFTHDEIFGDFHLAPKDRTGQTSYALNPGFFTPGETYRATVTPRDFFGHCSAPITCTFKAEHPAAKTVWTIGEKDFTATEDGQPLPKEEDGFYAPKSGKGVLQLPAKLFAKLEPGCRHRLIVDLHTVQTEGDWCGWRIALAPAADRRDAVADIQTPTGDTGVLRYVMEFTPGARFPESMNLLLPNVVPNGRIRALAARLEK